MAKTPLRSDLDPNKIYTAKIECLGRVHGYCWKQVPVGTKGRDIYVGTVEQILRRIVHLNRELWYMPPKEQ